MQTVDMQLISCVWQASETTPDEPRRITTSEAARQAGVSASTIRRWIRRGYLDATRTSAGYRVDASGLDAARARARSRGTTATQADRMVSEQPSVARETSEPEWQTLPELESLARQAAAPTVTDSAPHSVPAADRRRERTIERARVLEGLQRGLILEQAKYQRAVRHKDREAVRSCSYRLEELYQRLDDVQEDMRESGARARREAGSRRSLPGVAGLFSAATSARAARSRRMLNVATLLMLNGFLIMLMNVIA